MFADLGFSLKLPKKITMKWFAHTVLPVVGVAAGTTALVTSGAGSWLASKAGALLSSTKDFFVKSGVPETVAQSLAQQVTQGRQPIPPEVLKQLQSTQAGMFGFGGGIGLPIALGIGGLALIMMLPKKKGGR